MLATRFACCELLSFSSVTEKNETCILSVTRHISDVQVNDCVTRCHTEHVDLTDLLHSAPVKRCEARVLTATPVTQQHSN